MLRGKTFPFLWLLFLVLPLSSFTSTPESGPEGTTWTGQVVCSQCWFEADRTRVVYGTPGDLDCARRCSEAGVASALAVRDEHDGSFSLLLLDGRPPEQRSWLDLTGRFVRVSGTVETDAGRKTVRVASVEVLEDSPWTVSPIVEDAPPVSLSWTDLSGHGLSLDALRGRVVVLNFWATWCAPCRKEMPDLVRVQNKYGVMGVQVIGAAADRPDHAAEVLEYVRWRKLNFPIVLGADTEQMESLGLGVALPATVVLDREGRVVETFTGLFERAKLEAAVERALDGSGNEADHGAAGGHAARDTGEDHVHVASIATTQASLVPS